MVTFVMVKEVDVFWMEYMKNFKVHYTALLIHWGGELQERSPLNMCFHHVSFLCVCFIIFFNLKDCNVEK